MQAETPPQDSCWPAPAKLNLFLHITGRRPDGYHLLQTVFQFIDFCDELKFNVRDDGDVRRITEVAGVAESQDLVVRAARLLQSETGTSAGVNIEINKRIPMGGGLGGGSSDAATTLVALNELWQTGLSAQQLAALGLTLGADIPVFVQGHCAWAEGVGEHLEPIDLPEPWYLVVIPPCHVSTAQLFSAPELTRDAPPIKIRDFLAGQTHNAFEPVARHYYPEIGRVIAWLEKYGRPRLTGTGACVFLDFDSEQQARDAAAGLPEQWPGHVVKGMNTSPLLATMHNALLNAG